MSEEPLEQRADSAAGAPAPSGEGAIEAEAHVDELKAEIARLRARIAELESAPRQDSRAGVEQQVGSRCDATATAKPVRYRWGRHWDRVRWPVPLWSTSQATSRVQTPSCSSWLSSPQALAPLRRVDALLFHASACRDA